MNRHIGVSRRALTLAALLAAPFWIAPGDAPAQTRNVLIGAFDVGPGGFQGNFNPLAGTAGFTWFNLYFETLLLYDAKLESLSGALASGWTVSDDKLAYTFKLRPGVTWHDGRPFTSADVRHTFELAKNPKSGSIFAARLAAVKEVRTPDAMTAVIVLAQANSSLLDILAKLMILPKHALESVPVDSMAKHEWWTKSPVGTGPFSFVKFETDQFVELKANPAYRGGKPKLDGVINRYFRNSAGAVAALRAGEIQISYVEADDVKGFEGNAGFRIIAGDSMVINYVGFNHAGPIFKDVRVRRAFMHAIDRDAIVKSLYGGGARKANCSYVADHIAPKDIDGLAYDPAKARALLQEANWAQINGAKPINFLTYYNAPLAANVMAAMQAQLAQVGINVAPKAVEVAAYNATVYATSPDHSLYPLVYAGLQIGPDPGNLNIALNVKQIPPAGANIMRADFPDLTTALDSALGEAEDAKRPARFQEVCRSFGKNLPWGPMWVQTRYGVASTKLDGFVWTPSPGGGGYHQSAEKWALK